MLHSLYLYKLSLQNYKWLTFGFVTEDGSPREELAKHSGSFTFIGRGYSKGLTEEASGKPDTEIVTKITTRGKLS